jgi:hypothetical protein
MRSRGSDNYGMICCRWLADAASSWHNFPAQINAAFTVQCYGLLGRIYTKTSRRRASEFARLSIDSGYQSTWKFEELHNHISVRAAKCLFLPPMYLTPKEIMANVAVGNPRHAHAGMHW